MHFIFKISADLFGNLALTLSAQLSFQNIFEFGLRFLVVGKILLKCNGVTLLSLLLEVTHYL